jgi:ADP-ribose pyrophosphatase YjhB (NUDIX family)
VTDAPYHQIAHCPRCARPAARPAGNPFRCTSCGLVLFFNPASAVAAFIVRDDGKVLYIRRAKDPGRGQLGMPGGFVDAGESAESALRREVREEVGLELSSLEYLTSVPNRYPYGDVTYDTLDLFYVARAVNPDEARSLDDVDGTLWLRPVDVAPATIAFASMRVALVEYLKQRFPFGQTTVDQSSTT